MVVLHVLFCLLVPLIYTYRIVLRSGLEISNSLSQSSLGYDDDDDGQTSNDMDLTSSGTTTKSDSNTIVNTKDSSSVQNVHYTFTKTPKTVNGNSPDEPVEFSIFNHRKVKGDKKFIKQLVRFRKSLYPEGRKLDKKLFEAIKSNSPLLRVDKVPIAWTPVPCAYLGLELKVVKVLSDEGPKGNTVNKVWDRKTNRFFAQKLFGRATDYSAELSFLMVAKHPLIVRPFCIEHEKEGRKRQGIIMEYIKGRSSLAVAKDKRTTPGLLRRMAAQVLVALSYINLIGFVHADLKPDNILVRKNGDIVIIDFGYSLTLPDEHPGRGNPSIKAPELARLIKANLREGIDKWAYGSTLAIWHAYHYLRRYKNHPKRTYAMVFLRRGRPYKFGPVPLGFPPELCAVLYLLTYPNPELRRFQHQATLHLLRSMPFFSAIDWGDLDTAA